MPTTQNTQNTQSALDLAPNVGQESWANIVDTDLDEMLCTFSDRLSLRLNALFSRDGYVGFLDHGFRTRLASLLAETITAPASTEVIRESAATVLATVPVSPMFSAEFLTRVTDLVVLAVWPQGDPGPRALWDHLREAHDTVVHIGNMNEIHAEKHPSCTWQPYQQNQAALTH